MMRRAMQLPIVLIVLCSMGCAARQAEPELVLTPPPVECPAPVRPVLPALDPALPFDHPGNVEALMERDDLFRAYIQGLEATVDCYRRQIGGASWE